MNTPSRYLSILSSLILLLFTTSCISTAIDRSTNRHRGLFKTSTSRDQCRNTVGKPISSWDYSSEEKPKYTVKNMYAYDEFVVRGQIAREGDGAAQATINAVTLGTAEVITTPLTLVDATTKPFKKQTLVVFYDSKFQYINHQIYDMKGNPIDKLGY